MSCRLFVCPFAVANSRVLSSQYSMSTIVLYMVAVDPSGMAPSTVLKARSIHIDCYAGCWPCSESKAAADEVVVSTSDGNDLQLGLSWDFKPGKAVSHTAPCSHGTVTKPVDLYLHLYLHSWTLIAPCWYSTTLGCYLMPATTTSW